MLQTSVEHTRPDCLRPNTDPGTRCKVEGVQIWLLANASTATKCMNKPGPCFDEAHTCTGPSLVLP
jgi:hypothetical protein